MQKQYITVLHCIHSLSGGGAERQAKLLANFSYRNFMKPVVFCVNDNGHCDLDKSVDLYRSSSTCKYNFQLFYDIYRVIKAIKPDVVHAWIPASMTIPVMLVSCILRVPIIYSFRNVMKFYRMIIFFEYIVALFCSDGIVSNHDVSLSSFFYKKLFNYKRGSIIYNAISVGHSTNKYVTSSKYILFVGRLISLKNWKCLIDSVPYIRNDIEWKILICGSGPDEQEMRRHLLGINMSHKVELLGFRTDIYDIMRSATLVVLPSFSEGMPNVLIECLHIGVPCLVSNIKSCTDIVGNDESIVFNPHDPRMLSEKINDILGNEELRNLIIERGRSISKKFDPDLMAKKYNDYYRLIIQSM